ncbi:hypothetical protein TNCV_2328161 [Trichonephila clavipes]|nr:hypothetical protein TNCV_2328161 [Trichonephila clavipes]
MSPNATIYASSGEPFQRTFKNNNTNDGSCNVATPSSGRNLWWSRHPHVYLAAAAQPLFDPREIEHVDRKMREKRCFELTRERWPTNPPLTKYWTLTIYN